MSKPDAKPLQALFGGTFDPIHFGHLDLVRHALAALDPDTLWVCPAKQNPLKSDATSATGEERKQMVGLALQALGDPRVKRLDFELEAKGPSYTIRTVEHLKAKGEIALVMGNEVFATLPCWHEPKRLLSEANLFVVSREPMARDRILDTLAEIGLGGLKAESDRWRHEGGRWIMPRTISALPFSATAIRAAIRRYDERPEGLTDGVWSFIKERKLYLR